MCQQALQFAQINAAPICHSMPQYSFYLLNYDWGIFKIPCGDEGWFNTVHLRSQLSLMHLAVQYMNVPFGRAVKAADFSNMESLHQHLGWQDDMQNQNQPIAPIPS